MSQVATETLILMCVCVFFYFESEKQPAVGDFM